MMMETIDALWLRLQAHPETSGKVGQCHAQWQAYAKQATLRTVVFGAYDTGKSSLLKRLLVDADVAVPSWLTISARRETFESREVVAGPIAFVDSPGLKSGNDAHDTISHSALQLADAYLWVMPPQLVTSGQADFLAFLKGSFFHPRLPSAAVTAATIAVISRMDEAGIDPGDNPEGFASLVQKKLEEFANMLAKDAIAGPLRGVHCIVADAYQMVGSTPNPDPSMYDVGREWDGMQGLRASLAALECDKDRLRQMAGLRFVCAVARELDEAVRAQCKALELQAEGLTNDVQRYGLFRERVASVVSHASSDLKMRVEEALRSAGRTAGADGQLAAGRLEVLLSGSIDEWAAESGVRLQGLAKSLELELQERETVVDMSGLREAGEPRQDSRAEGQPNTFSKHRTRLFGFMPVVTQSLKGVAEMDLGMSIEQAREGIEKLDNLKGKALKDAIKDIFKTDSRMEKASSYVRWSSAVGVVGPLVGQLASFGGDLLEEHLDQRAVAARLEERNLIRQQLDGHAAQIREQAQQVFAGLAGSLDEQLQLRRQDCLESQQAVLQQQRQAYSFLEDLGGVLSQAIRMLGS